MDFSLSDEQQMLRDLCARFRDDHVRPLERLVLAREAEGGTKILQFGVTDEEAWEVGLTCGGEVEIYIERVE